MTFLRSIHHLIHNTRDINRYNPALEIKSESKIVQNHSFQIDTQEIQSDHQIRLDFT